MSAHKGIRIDRIFGIATLISLLIFFMMIYFDFFANDSSEETENKSSKATIEATQTEAKEKNGADEKEKCTSGVVVCLDASHGGKDNGISYKSNVEKNITLDMVLAIKKELESVDVKVVLTRDADKDVSDSSRTKICNDSKAKLVVSFGMNTYSDNENVSGAEAFIHTSNPKESKSLSDSILKRMSDDLGVKNRGVKTGKETTVDDNFYINAHSKCTSAVINLGFMTNKTDINNVTTKKDATAKAIAGGITDYLKQAGLY